ncbi:MAG: hypothetical protein MI865_04295 [Proteobacteria bacterium]|nr:hypothetical protein [Pseudomonadota bacterium]
MDPRYREVPGIFYVHGWAVCRERTGSPERRSPWMGGMSRDTYMDVGGRAKQEPEPRTRLHGQCAIQKIDNGM